MGIWRVGDVWISWFDLAVDADGPPPYHLRLGMYVYTPPDQFEAVAVVDATGSPAGGAVEWQVE